MFDVRIVNVDHYTAVPLRGLDPVYSDFRGTSVSQVPVIRIFGSTASGKKTCLHIHGVFPYIYVPYDGESDPNQQSYQLAASLDRALNIALGTANSTRQHIFKIAHVKGVPFYGYHEKSHQFLKIYFYNPLIVKKATDLLQNGAVCNKIFQCHEAHLPFILQFFIDYNLHGMSFIQLASVDFREELGTIPSNLQSDARPAKTTYCELEVDGLASDILNRKTISDGEVANPGLAGIWSEERLRNEVSQISQNQSQERTGAKKTLSDVLLRQRLREAIDQLGGRISGGSASTVVYPAESTPGDHVHDASLVEGLCNSCTEHDLSTLLVNLDDSIIDEQLVLSLSQAPASSQDHSLLDIMQSLAERGVASCENEEDWVTSLTQKSAETLLSQSFHCSNMEVDSILGVSPDAVRADECPQNSDSDENVEKEDCWQDSFWNGLDTNDIPQLDGALDECDEKLEGSGRDTPSISRQTHGKIRDRPIRINGSISKNPSRVSSPILIDSSEDDSYMDCAPLNIFNQERFWCVKTDNDDKELENLMLADTIAPALSLKPELYTNLPDTIVGELNTCENVDSSYENVLMRGDPSLISLAEVASEDNYVNSNLIESNCEPPESESNDNMKSKLTSEENNLDISLSTRELEEDPDGIVTSSELMFSLDYEYSTFEDQVDNVDTWETVTKRKLKKGNKSARGCLKYHCERKINENKNSPNLGKRKHDLPNNQNLNRENKKAKNNECKIRTRIKQIDLNVSKQDNVEMNNNEKESKQDFKIDTKKNRKIYDNMSGAISVKSKEDTELTMSRKIIKKPRKSGKIVDETEYKETKKSCENINKNRLDNSSNETSDDEDFKVCREFIVKPKKSSENEEWDGNASNKTSIIHADNDHVSEEEEEKEEEDHDDDDDDADLFRINLQFKTKGKDRFRTQIVNQTKRSSKAPDSSLQSTGLQLGNGPSDDKVSFPCYFFKSDGVVMRINFPSKRLYLNEKTKQCIIERRSVFQNKLFPKVDFRIQPSNLEDEFLTKEMFEEYYGQDEDMPSINLFGPTDLVHNDCLTPKKRKILDSVILKKKVGISNPCSRTSIKSNEQHLSPNKNLSQALKKCRSEDCVNVDTNSSVSLPKISKKMSKSLDFGLNSEANKSSDLTRLDDPISPNVEVTDEFLSPEQGESLKREANVSRFLAQSADSPSVKAKTKQLLSLKHGKRPSPSKARLTQNKAKLLPKTSAQKQSRYRYGLDEFELSENDINSPNKIKSLNLPTNLRFASSSPHKKGSVKAEKDLIMSPFVKKKYKLESPIETEKQSANTSCASFDELQSLNKRQSNNSIKRQKKIGKVSLKMNNKFEKYIRLYNIKPCRVVVDRLPENPKSLAVKKSCSTMKQEYGVSKQTLQCNSVECKPQLLHYTTPIEMLISPQRLDMNPDLQVCSEKKLDVSQVPFSKAELHETYQEQDEEDTYNLWRQDRLSPLHCKLSVRLDRLDQSMFSRVNQNKKSFKIDNLDGCFGEDTSSDEDVTITPARKIGNSKDSASKVDSDRKRSHSTVPRTCTPRPRYKPLKVKITKSPPRKTRALPKCMVLLKKLDFNTDVGSSSNTIPVQLGSVDDSKNPNPVDDAVSSHNALSGSDDSDIFGEILFQQKPKEGMTFEGKLEVECDKEDCKDLGSSSVPKLDSHTSQRPELKMGTAGLTSKKVVDESIGDQLLNSSESNTGDCSQKRSSLCRDASSIEPIILEGKSENANYINMPGPSTSNAQPWCKAKVYETFSSSDENEDNGVLSFYDTSVYIPGNDSDSEKSSYEIHSQADELSQVSGEHEKIYIPKIQPPTPNEILSSLSKYGLSKELNCEPFCSDISDRTSTEVGPVSLKLKSRLAIVLEEYDGPFSKGVCMYRNNVLKGLQVKRSSVLASDRDVVLIPLQRPPSCAEVRKWLKVKSKIELKTKNCVTDEKCEKLERLIVPCSPGQNHSSDDEQNTLILTPMTPTCRRHSTPSDCPPGGSLTATITPVCTPVPFAPTQGTKRRHSNIIKKSSAKLLKDFSAMSSIQENETDSVVCEKDEKNLSENVQLSDSSIYISDETREKMEADLKKKARLSSSFQIEACNSDSTSGLPNRVDNLQKTRPQIQHQFLTLMILELHVQTRGELLPDPENDPIRAIFYHIVNDVPEEAEKTSTLTGIIAVGHLISEDENVFVTCVADELSLLSSLVELTRKWDPDMFIGYEIEKLSWGYLIERAYTLGMNLNVELSRVMGVEGSSKYEDEQGMLGGDSEQLDIRLAGRIVLNVWRLLRHEVALQSYTFENIMYHVLRRRIPLFSFRSLSAWWEHRTHLYRWMTVEHYLLRVRGIAEILDNLDLIGRTSELARLFGIQFYEVLSRGSQFRVESMMLRMAKPENYVAVSPTTKQRAHMRAPESLPLIMEPESRFYSDPVIVLDFQSLYPSIIIAYNYCFSTCLGRVENLAKSELFDFGCTHLRVPFSTVKKLEENLTFSPCGVAFVNSTVRKGVLPRMLQEILETRLMVKKSMKKNKNNKALHKVLHNRQLGLKLIANVTYGYTSANFSGRMPCIEIGDSVVSKGRETLERAIALVNKTEKWGARVVYGDTDSLFVLVPGRSRAEAFHIGAEIAEAVTAENPKPVKLKLEKVYQPCILQTKKRYVGHMWESPDQASPTYDAKGIETVRRDGCPAVAKILQKSLQLLFETKDVSIVKRFILHQFGKVSSGRISIQELTFAREYRGARGYKPGACVPALELARSWMKKDRRSEPRVGERVPYVVVSGPPGLPLIRLVRCPRAVMADPAMKINADYYITRVIIPPLNRCLLLVGANAHNWFNSMPRRLAPSLPSAVPSGIKKATISQYFATVSCVVCHTAQTTSGLCDTCRAQPQSVAVSLATHLHSWERRRHLVSKVCQSCCRQSNNIDCVSIDCPVLYARADADRDLAHEPVFRQLQHDYFNCDF